MEYFKIIDGIKSSKDLDELRIFLEEDVFEEELEDDHHVYHNAESLWHEAVISTATDQDFEVLGESREVDDTEYQVIPVVHGDLFRRPNDNVVDMINNSIRNESEIFTEQKLDGLIDGESIEIDDQTWASENFESFEEGTLMKSLKRPLVVKMRKLKNNYIPGKEVEKEGSQRKCFDPEYALESMQNQSKFKNLDLRERSVSLPFHLKREFNQEHFPEYAVTVQERSLRMAEYAVHASESDDVTMVVGGGHYPEILDILEMYEEDELEQEPYIEEHEVRRKIKPRPKTESALAILGGSISLGGFAVGDSVTSITGGALSFASAKEAKDDYIEAQKKRIDKNYIINRDGLDPPESHLTSEYTDKQENI